MSDNIFDDVLDVEGIVDDLKYSASNKSVVQRIKNYGVNTCGTKKEFYNLCKDRQVVDEALVRNTYVDQPRTLRSLLYSEVIVIRSESNDISGLNYAFDYVARTILLNLITQTPDTFMERYTQISYIDLVKETESFAIDINKYKQAGLLSIKGCYDNKTYPKANDYLEDILSSRNGNTGLSDKLHKLAPRRCIATLIGMKSYSESFCGLKIGKNCRVIDLL